MGHELAHMFNNHTSEWMAVDRLKNPSKSSDVLLDTYKQYLETEADTYACSGNPKDTAAMIKFFRECHKAGAVSASNHPAYSARVALLREILGEQTKVAIHKEIKPNPENKEPKALDEQPQLRPAVVATQPTQAQTAQVPIGHNNQAGPVGLQAYIARTLTAPGWKNRILTPKK